MIQDFHSNIAQLSYEKFNTLPKTGKPAKTEWTVLSTIVKEVNFSQFEVVALGTGSKCIGKTCMSPTGDILNDSHAEVVCRRAFLRYLYNEIKYSSEGRSEIFTINEKNVSLKQNIRFHFFTTHVPCGDAAIFPKQNDENFGNCIVQPTIHERPCSFNISSASKKRLKVSECSDMYRTGAKCLPEGELHDSYKAGAAYHVLGAVRTKPGRGIPTLSASCSDKLAKWMCLGVQGALLLLLINEPVYLSSFTLAGKTPFCKEALSRALYDRFEPQIELKPPFKQKKIMFCRVDAPFECCKNDATVPCPSSIIWSKTAFRSLEVAIDGRKQGLTKKNINKKQGRLKICKIELFREFIDACKFLQVHSDIKETNYIDVKKKAVEYQQTWDFIKRNHFKIWTKKNEELLHFFID